ncbi:hypothetical protein Acr_00g0058880 [Actinidia rufa]|uniref:Uncharacterized protein n=1 Tax=Actinidia rufa TaxID=165716 RepID=A0A7J0DNJ5_9ERIC|nr:hypothetical protein Acr_00g0058880 [Actinidia rufa]
MAERLEDDDRESLASLSNAPPPHLKVHSYSHQLKTNTGGHYKRNHQVLKHSLDDDRIPNKIDHLYDSSSDDFYPYSNKDSADEFNLIHRLDHCLDVDVKCYTNEPKDRLLTTKVKRPHSQARFSDGGKDHCLSSMDGYRHRTITTKQARWGPYAGARSRILRDISSVRAKVNVTSELSLYSKLDRVTAPRLGRGATAGGDPKAQQGPKVDLHGKVSSDNPYA